MKDQVEACCLVIDFAHDLAHIEPDPAAWTPYLIMLAARLEAEAVKSNQPQAIQGVYAQLCDELTQRLNSSDQS